jgi:heat shock protein HslJ
MNISNRIFAPLLLWVLLSTACSAGKKSAQSSSSALKGLQGTWVLDLIPSPDKSFDEVYPERKPEISFDIAAKIFNGNTSCNNFNGQLAADDTSINFQATMAMTRMACEGEGEADFLKYLSRINRYSVSSDGKVLTMIQGDVALLRFHKKQ